jgi:hypothetical protein
MYIDIEVVIAFLKKMMENRIHGYLKINLEDGKIVLYIDKNYHKK